MHEKMLSVTSLLRNANQNHNEVSTPVGKTSIKKKKRKTGKDTQKMNFCALLVGMQISWGIMQHAVGVPQKIKNRSMIFWYRTFGCIPNRKEISM